MWDVKLAEREKLAWAGLLCSEVSWKKSLVLLLQERVGSGHFSSVLKFPFGSCGMNSNRLQVHLGV